MTATSQPKLLKSRQFHSRIFAVVAIFLLLTTSPLMDDESTLRVLMLWLGYGLMIAGAFGRVYCSVFIGGRKNKDVMRLGPFSVVRNPLYIFSFLATVGIGLQSGMLIVAVLLPLAFILYYPKVVAREESYLRHRFGEQYDVYVREVPRWKPNMQLWNEPQEVVSMPLFIRRTIMDASIFFLPMPLFALIHTLQHADIIPVWLTLL